MNNEQEIEKMELLIVNDILLNHNAEETAEHLHKYGIGDKKQAVKEFADKLKTMFNQSMQYGTVRRCIDELFTELYGANE